MKGLLTMAAILSLATTATAAERVVSIKDNVTILFEGPADRQWSPAPVPVYRCVARQGNGQQGEVEIEQVFTPVAELASGIRVSLPQGWKFAARSLNDANSSKLRVRVQWNKAGPGYAKVVPVVAKEKLLTFSFTPASSELGRIPGASKIYMEFSGKNPAETQTLMLAFNGKLIHRGLKDCRSKALAGRIAGR